MTGWMGLEWPLTAEENVRLFGVLCGLDARTARQRAEEALCAVELWGDRGKYSSQLSNGMRQRVILARALLLRTPLVLLDEPTVGLDPHTARVMLALIRDRLVASGQTVILTDHVSAEMEAVADRVAVLDQGRMVLSDTPAALVGSLADLTVLDVHTEETPLPVAPPPPEVRLVHCVERPGPVPTRVWRHSRRARAACAECGAGLDHLRCRRGGARGPGGGVQARVGGRRALRAAAAHGGRDGGGRVSNAAPQPAPQPEVEPAGQAGLRHTTGTLWAFALRECRIWQSYQAKQLMWVANIFVTTLMFFLMGKMLGASAASRIGPACGTNYMSFIVVGIMVNSKLP